MEGNRPQGLWLWADNCCNGPVLVAADLTPQSAMFLMWGWKSFARSRGLGSGHLLQRKFNNSSTLTVKFFRESDTRLECCTESSSGSDLDSSNDSDNDASVFGIKQEDSD
ncbi:hypothetical protein D1007_41600 [Hordeum vulgare]|nr:hypothetical protein D1007_41600 [Hordeum vulgare]